MLPFVSCLCCTRKRAILLANTVACYLSQDYPQDRREMIILDDANQFETKDYPEGYRVISLEERAPSLSEKHTMAAAYAQGVIFIVWDDDDIYLPHHVSSHVKVLEKFPLTEPIFSKPSQVFSTYDHFHQESGAGRFHGSMGMTREAFHRVGKWPIGKIAQFDQIMINRLAKLQTVDPCTIAPPSYVYRWETTGTVHPSSLMKSPDDETWYDEYDKRIGEGQPGGPLLYPNMDEETKRIYAWEAR